MEHSSPVPISKAEMLLVLRRRFSGVYFVLALVVAEVMIINATNTPSSIPVFLFLLLILVGICLQVSTWRALLVWLPMMILWIGAKRMLGIWSWPELGLNLSEAALLLGISITAGLFRSEQNKTWEAYIENQLRMQAQDVENNQAGLLRPAFGQIRLAEEEERALYYHRQLSLLLVQIQPYPEAEWFPDERTAIYKAVATALKDAAQETDIPYMVSEERMGLVMPETGIEGVQVVLDRLVENLVDIRYILKNSEAELVQARAQVRYGYAVFLGSAGAKPELLQAATVSLEKSIQDNQGSVYQNLFIEFETIGTPAVSYSPVLAINE